MPIAVAGAGYVGLTTAACLCELGHEVALLEIDPQRVARLQRGECPFYEPGLDQLLRRHLGRSLTVTPSLDEAIGRAEMLIVCVGTPPSASGAPDLQALWRLLDDLRERRPAEPLVVVLKSTVPPGTNRRAQRRLGPGFVVVSNPEFLREGTAIHDFFHPDRIVVGAESAPAARQVADLYRGIDAPLVTTGWEEAELIKYASNAFLAVKLSFANEVAALADALGADGLAVLKGVGLDRRIGGHFLHPGPGYGGSCLPKDLAALLWTARRRRVRLDLLPAARRANLRQRERVLAMLEPAAGRRIAVWGLAFKAGTDDVRESPALAIVPALLAQGARVLAHDPQARGNFAAALAAGRPEGLPPGLRLVADPWEAARGADALLVLTEWPEYAAARPEEIRSALAGDLVVDARNLFDPGAMAAAGLRYRGVGRSMP
ncbi:UDP-glucose dehydrogenase family protein [Symbiobacterium thermophilum]|uniref:UDP-glucose 6-dehydrogenase n=1 Tax=Symbiobacterium thermophilum TaxID=2734 RepID=A0A953LGW3_SYMTR|nr:nucleotide sugar dehydrogenase [Symbiobacterium thermophilum]MBY6275631.1 UDP-glucose 6-dehydrogenase [Symbiobacterium thermophilum]